MASDVPDAVERAMISDDDAGGGGVGRRDDHPVGAKAGIVVSRAAG